MTDRQTSCSDKNQQRLAVCSGDVAGRYALLGAVFGAGSPLGLLLIRYFQSFHSTIFEWLLDEIAFFGWIYLYMGVGTILVFSLLGYLAGRRNDGLTDRAELLENTSNIDGLTGFYVRRYLLGRLEEEIKRAARYGDFLGCLFVDVDNFKRFNDHYGHLFGDKVLAGVAESIRQSVRDTDFLGRYGGDEFLVILPQADGRRAYCAAERIRQSVETVVLESTGERSAVTVSIGVMSAIPGGMSAEDFLEKADRALHRSKAQGKNMVVMAGEEKPAERKSSLVKP